MKSRSQIPTKEKAQQAIGLNMEQIKAEKQDFIKTVIPQWEEQARKRSVKPITPFRLARGGKHNGVNMSVLRSLLTAGVLASGLLRA